MVTYVPNMKLYSCQVCFLVLISAVLICTLDADTLEDSECAVIEVKRFTVRNVSRGQELRITCPVTFCSDTPPKVSWYKIEGTLPFNLSKNSHIKTEWKTLGQSKGEAYLIFKNILYEDAGVYRCELPGIVAHGITVFVSGPAELSTVTTMTSPMLQQQTTLTSENPSAQYTLWHYMYRIFGILAVVFIVSAVCGIYKFWYKGKAKSSSHPSLGDGHHIYENDL